MRSVGSASGGIRSTLVRATSIIGVLVAMMSVLVAAPAGSAPVYGYFGQAAGTRVSLLGGVVTSDDAWPATLKGGTYPNSSGNVLAAVEVDPIVRAGVSTAALSADGADGRFQQRSTSEIVGVSLLDGLIRARALTTTATARVTDHVFSGRAHTELVGIDIAGQTIPLTVPRNFTVEIPGIAKVVLNQSVVTRTDSYVVVAGSAITVTLLTDFADAAIGSVIVVNPVVAAIGRGAVDPQPVTAIGGHAYATSADVRAGLLRGARALSGQSARTGVPAAGTNGREIGNTTEQVALPKLLRVGVLESRATASTGAVAGNVETVGRVAQVDLLGGLITADAVVSRASAAAVGGSNVATVGSSELIGLRIAGRPIPVAVPANTVIGIPGVAAVILNEQVRTSNGITVTAVRVVLNVPLPGLPVGADVRLAVANAWAGD